MLRARLGNIARRLRHDYRGRRLQAVSREIFFRLARRFTPVMVAESEGLQVRMPTYDRALSLRTFVGCPPEKDPMELTLARLDARGGLSTPGDVTFLEIGANIGTATMIALGQFGFRDAICFEPLPDNYRLLNENLTANGFSQRAKVMGIALSDHNGLASFEISPNNSGDGRVRVSEDAAEDMDAFAESSREVIDVKLATLDALCEQGELDLSGVGLVWMDAQGHEGHILAGAQRLLQSPIPVVTEFWPYGLNRSGGGQAFIDAVRSNYETIVELRPQRNGSSPTEMPADEIETLYRQYEKGSFFDPGAANANTDLLLLKAA